METRNKITIHTDFLTAVTTLSKRKLHLDTITSAIRDAASRLTQMPTQREAYDLIGYTLQLMQAHSGTKQG